MLKQEINKFTEAKIHGKQKNYFISSNEELQVQKARTGTRTNSGRYKAIKLYQVHKRGKK